jgi:hypothetical protein
MRIWIRNTDFSLRICYLRINNLPNLLISNLRTGIPQKFADLRLWNETTNLRICDLRTNKKICLPTFKR